VGGCGSVSVQLSRWPEKTEIDAGRIIGRLDITASKFYDWREHYGKVNEHNGWVPRDFWLEDWEKQAIIGFHHPFWNGMSIASMV